jgi:hypothetical protein
MDVPGAFEWVLFTVCGLGIVAALAAVITSGKTWEEYGKGRLLLDRDAGPGPAAGSAAALVERDAEIRQLLEARSRRRERRGEPPLDIERELSRLTALQVDGQLRREIRELVIARNHRRARAGKVLLDVEAEVAREIGELTTLSEP